MPDPRQPTAPRRVVVIPRYVAAYRVPFFDALDARLTAHGISLVVAEGRPPPSMERRRDARRGRWSVALASRWWRVGRYEIGWRSLRALTLADNDVVVIEQALKNLDTYGLLLRRRSRRPRIAFWGHGRTYSLPHNGPREWLKQRLTRRGDWLLVYTESGARSAAEGGFPADRITILRNTIDTGDLRRAIDAASEDVRSEMRTALGLTPGRTALFLGGVDAAKGIDFLLTSAAAVRKRIPDFVLLIGGEGDELEQVRARTEGDDAIRILGRLDGPSKARALAVADVLLIPQWIGLVAVDSLVSGVPIVSTDNPSHGPEREYLVDGVTAVFTEPTVEDYADGIIALLADPGRLASLQEACSRESREFSIDAMVDSFVRGIEQMCSQEPRH